MDVLAFPLRFAPSGRAVTLEQGSDSHAAQQISQFVQTRLGELLLAPGYGLDDPTFRTIESNEIVAGIGVFHPTIRITNINNRFSAEGVQAIDISFETSAHDVTRYNPPLVDGQVTLGA